MRSPAVVLIGLFVAAAIAAEEGEAPPAFEGEGRVLSIDEKNSSVTLDHDAIPGFMPAMKMRFKVARRAQLHGLKVGDSVRFWLGTRGEEMVIVAISPMRKLPVNLLRVSHVLGADVGEDLPDVVVRQSAVDPWHGLLRDLPLDELEQGLVVAPEPPHVVDDGGRHATAAAHAVAA
jgi:Cu/Ag efflux protein CusF